MNAVTPLSRPGPETDAERRDRQLAALREISELGMDLVRAAAARALASDPPDPDAPAPPDPNLAFARAASVVRQAIALEIRIAAGTQPPSARPRNPDPRRPALRQALHKLADAEPDRAARAQLRREIDERLDDELRADPDAELLLAEILIAICDDLGLPVDVTKLSNHFLGIPPVSRPTGPEPPD